MDGGNSKNNQKILMQEATDGDTEAFGRIYEIYFAPIFRYVLLRIRDKEATEDLVQDVFLKTFRSVNRYQEKGRPPLAYFFTVARNAIIDYSRKQKEIKLNDPEKTFAQMADTNQSPQETLEKQDAAEMLQHAISRLPDDQQEVIVLKFVNELSNSEIAEILGKTEEAIRQLQCRGLKALRQYLKESKLI